MHPKARQTGVLVHNVDGEVVVYDKTQQEAHLLNETVGKVWPLLDGKRSVADLATELGVDESIVSLSLDELAGVDLLEAGEPLSLTRRAALRRAAAAAAAGLVLPAITSIVAPIAAQAQSGGPAQKKKAKIKIPAKKKAAAKKKAPAKKKVAAKK